MKINAKKIIISIFCLGCIIFISNQALAVEGLVPDGPVPGGKPEDMKKDTGSYEVNDFVVLGITIANYILGIVGSLTLLMVLYGGFELLISHGNTQQIDSGKKIIGAAFVGLIIVFSAYMIVSFSMRALGLQWSGGGTVKPTVIK
jgi:hypothetical protein